MSEDNFALVSDDVAREVLWTAIRNQHTLDHLVRKCGVSTFAYKGDVYMILAQRGATATTMSIHSGTQVVKIVGHELLHELNDEQCGRPFLVLLGRFLKKLDVLPKKLFAAVERHTKIALTGNEFATLPDRIFDESDESPEPQDDLAGLPPEIADHIRDLRARGHKVNVSMEFRLVQLPPDIDPTDEAAIFAFIQSLNWNEKPTFVDDGSFWPKNNVDEGDE